MLYELGPRALRVYAELRDRIQSGALAPGTRLAAHTQLAASFGVAPLTMRQVLARLEAERLIVRERGRGTFVRAADAAHVLVVAADLTQRAELEKQVHTAGKRPLIAATAAEALATLKREGQPDLAIVDLRLPDASAGLGLVRRLRQEDAELRIALVNPTRRQRTRLEHSLAPPWLFVGDPPLTSIAEAVRATPASDGRLLERYLELQLGGERQAARSLILQQPLSAAEVYRSVLQPAQYRVGELWQINQISVAREHMASAVTESVMGDVAASAPRGPTTRLRAVVACVEGELHDIGARMVANLLEIEGIAVLFLGANVPTDSLVGMLGEESARLLVLSASMAERLVELRTAVARVRQAFGARSRIFVGGQIMDWVPEAVRALDVNLAARHADETLAAARRLASARV